jgi:hypothetical protein
LFKKVPIVRDKKNDKRLMLLPMPVTGVTTLNDHVGKIAHSWT